MYVGGLLNNVEQHANIDHNNDVDNPHYTCKELRIQQPSVSLPVVSVSLLSPVSLYFQV